MNFKNRHIISIDDFSKEELLYILDVAKSMKQNKELMLSNKILATLFFEPSTRTRLSHEAAMMKLGGKVIGFSDPSSSSHKKGETLHDTIKMVEQYADVIVMRHYLDGAARAAARNSKVPIINAGDGANQHPTQTLLDLYTIFETQGSLENLKIAMVGDLKYGRTTHSLSKALSLFNAELYFVAPKELQMTSSIIEELKEKKIKYKLSEKIEDVIEKVDILYMTRIQKERFPDVMEYEKVKNAFILEKSMLVNAKTNMKIMHPLPRVNEISTDVDETPHAYYFEQAGNGIPVRQALLCLVLGAIPGAKK